AYPTRPLYLSPFLAKVLWKDGNYYIGFLNDYPDYETQGLTKEELVENLRSLLHDIRSDQIPFVRKVEELVVSA
ncbi:MAG TPA: hypothetical protein PL187_15555, partial [Caldilinea sp.]|nr:hypothetical protein [Caldilinea sp.]